MALFAPGNSFPDNEPAIELVRGYNEIRLIKLTEFPQEDGVSRWNFFGLNGDQKLGGKWFPPRIDADNPMKGIYDLLDIGNMLIAVLVENGSDEKEITHLFQDYFNMKSPVHGQNAVDFSESYTKKGSNAGVYNNYPIYEQYLLGVFDQWCRIFNQQFTPGKMWVTCAINTYNNKWEIVCRPSMFSVKLEKGHKIVPFASATNQSLEGTFFAKLEENKQDVPVMESFVKTL